MEKETAEAVAKAVVENPGVVGGAFASLSVAFGWLLKRLYGGIGHRITAASQAAANATAAVEKVEERRRSDSIALHLRLGEHIERDVEMHTQVLNAMHAQTSKLGDIHASLEKALGERPTRDEVNRLIELHQGSRAA